MKALRKRALRRRNRGDSVMQRVLNVEHLEPRIVLSTPYISTFRTDSAPDLDLYQPCSGGDNQILFDIDVQGIDTTAIQSSWLTLRVWDVDENGSGTNGEPERDPVFLNGHQLTQPTWYLTGADEYWSTCTFDVDPTWIVDGSNQVQIDIDVLDGGWCVRCDWGELNIEAQEVRVDQLSAFDDVNLAQNGSELGDVVWEIGGISHPIADAAKGSFFGLIPGSFKMKTRVGVDAGSFPDEELTVKYEWWIPGTGQAGDGQFSVNASNQEGEFAVSMPASVGKYSLETSFEILDEKGRQINQQDISQTLYATLDESLFPSAPEVVWVDQGTFWAEGATDAEQVAQAVYDSVYASQWAYRDIGAGGTSDWRQLVDGSAAAGNCYTFSNVWSNVCRVLGVNTATEHTFGGGAPGRLNFVTKTGAVSPDSITGNAHSPGASPDRWVFVMHQVGRYGSWMCPGTWYYDPTFHDSWSGSIDSFIEWPITGETWTLAHGYVYLAG